MERMKLIKKIENLNAKDFANFDYEFLKTINPGDETPNLQDQINNWKGEDAKISTFKGLMINIINSID